MYRIRPLAAVGTDSSAATRAALVEAATPLFIAHGFEGTKTRDIADKARANVSAINYHFGSKMGLYQAVIKKQAEAMIATYPLETEAVRGSDPATRLRWLVLNLLRRVFTTQEDDGIKICAREFVEPTEALDYLVNEIVRHQFAIMKAVVAAVLEREAEEVEIHRFAVSVVSQCYHYGMAEPMLTRLGVKMPETDEDIEALADHIARFSLAGLRAAREVEAA